MAGARAELLQIKELGAAVPFAEGMDVVEVADDAPRLPGEGLGAQSAQMIARHQPAVNVGHAVGEVAPELEPMPGLGDLDDTQLASPGIDILEQMAVDRLKMGEVEPAGRSALGDPLDHQLTLDALQLVRVPDAQPVAKNGEVERP